VALWRSFRNPDRMQAAVGDTTEMGGEIVGDAAGLAESDPAVAEEPGPGRGEAPVTQAGRNERRRS
jgi:hypothetical protein